ncbi:hypothetical protein FAGAP_1029 [Fusarium agapanthi]|uniref:DUF8035 domain-containing protein n=1 Tax=Fusarium agapanthi TaxID=1803897 RepID=A0A9P5BPW3_9HYPO|nr:hypothetical protein FAGAP_1029 [Fusarium agapanthi]
MTTVERWHGQLPSRLRGGEGSSTQAATQDSPDVECPEGLRHKLSNWRASVSFRSPPTITSKPAQQVDPKTPQYEESDSGIGITTPSSQDHHNEPPGLELPGTELRHFDRPVSDRLKARFFDIKVLYTQPLLDYILKRKKDPGDISMKLKYLGLSSLSAQLHIIIQCERKIAKRVRKFFAQGHVEEELLPDFRVFVLEKALLRLTDDDAIEVLTDSVPERTWCGAPIRLRRGNVSVVATFGGIIVVETAHKRLVGLTAAHSLKKLHNPLSSQLSTSDTEVPFSSSSSDASESESGSDCDSTFTTESSMQHPEHLNDKGLDTTASQDTLEIGHILCNTFNAPMAQNYDWAIIDLSLQATLPNRVVLDGQSSSDFEEENDLEPIIFPVGNPCVSVSRKVMVLKQGAKPIGEMSLDTSSVLISPGSSFVEVYDLAMEHGHSLSPGDSGSWVVDEKTSVLYGHVVSTDAFGEAQVMPIRSTLDSIKVQMNAARVFLPNSDEIRLLQEESRGHVPANLEVSPVAEPFGRQEVTQITHLEDMKGGQSGSSLPPTEASDESSSKRAVSRQDIVAQSLEIARESPDGASYPSIREILESALEEIWTKVQDQPDSYIMTRDEFAVFNFFQHRFAGDKMAMTARKRYWQAAALMDSSESTKTESGDLAQIDAIRELVQASYRRIGTYGPGFANVATKLYKLEMTLRRLRDEVAEEQEELPVHIQQSYTNHLHSLVEDWDFAMKRVNSLLDTYHEEEISLAGEEASKSGELKPIEPVLAGKRMAIEFLLDSIQLQKPQIYDQHQSDLEEIKDKVDHIAAHLFAHWNAGSFSGGNDDLWRHFQELLEKEGFSSQILSKKKDILMAYINDLGYIADTTANKVSHARNPLDKSPEHVPNNKKKPDVEDKYDASTRIDLVTTEDIIASDNDDSVIQQIERRLTPNESDALQQTRSSPGRSMKISHLAKDPSPKIVSSLSANRRKNDTRGSTQPSGLVDPDQSDRVIADNAQWTKISRKLVSVEVLQRAGVRYEARPDYVAILGVLSREEVASLVLESEATITSRPPPAYPEDKNPSAQGRPVSPSVDDWDDNFLPLLDIGNTGSAVARVPGKGFRKAHGDEVTARKQEGYPPRGSAEKMQGRPGSRQEKFSGRPRRRSHRSPRHEPHRERNDWSGLQQSVWSYDKGGRGGLVGIGSAAVSLLSVLSEAASAI